MSEHREIILERNDKDIRQVAVYVGKNVNIREKLAEHANQLFGDNWEWDGKERIKWHEYGLWAL